MRATDRIYATESQESYLNRLWQQAQKYRTAEWPRPSRRLLRHEASAEIDMLKRAIAKGEGK